MVVENNEDDQTLSDLLFNEIAFENTSYDNTYIDINNNYIYNLSEEENYFLLFLPEDFSDNETDENSENNRWRKDYLSFVDNYN